MDNIYSILGINEGCSSEELKSAFMAWKKRQQEILKTGKPVEQTQATKRITEVTKLYKTETNRLQSRGGVPSATYVDVGKNNMPMQETVIERHTEPGMKETVSTAEYEVVADLELTATDDDMKTDCKSEEINIKPEANALKNQKPDVQCGVNKRDIKASALTSESQSNGKKNIGIVVAIVLLIGVSYLGYFLLKGNNSGSENQVSISGNGLIVAPKAVSTGDGKKDAVDYNKKMAEYAKRLQDFNKSLINKNEVVFLAEKVENPKSVSDLCITGKFYNGTPDNVTGVKEILVDVNLRHFDDEVITLKNVSVNNPIFHSMPMSPSEYSDTVTIVLPNVKVEKEYNNFEVMVHGIHWTRRVLVKR